MNNSNFWNDAAKWGLRIGVIMGASRIVEYGLMLSGEAQNFALLTIEWVVVAVVFGVLLYQAVRVRAIQIYDTIGFSFGHSLNYALIISMFASVVVAAMTYIYINSVVGGYEIYLDSFMASVIKVLDEAQADGTMMDFYKNAFAQLQSEDVVEPSIFNTLLSTLSTYILAGTAVGVIVSMIVKRKIKKIFSDEQSDGQ